MQRWHGAALAVTLLCSACLEPLTDDKPGYSRNVLDAGAPVASAYADLQINRKIEINDGLTGPVVPIKTGYAGGEVARYWDLGPAKARTAPAYDLATCENGAPIAADPVVHPLIMETIPGDADYSPFRAISYACVIPSRYTGQQFTSVEALEDGIELGLIEEPRPADIWVNVPIVGRGIDLSFGERNQAPERGFYKGREVLHHSFMDQEGPFRTTAPPPAGYVYEIARLGFATTILKVIFSQRFLDGEGRRNQAYSPQWILVAVTLRGVSQAIPGDAEQEAADIASWDSEDDIVTLSPMGVPAPKAGTRVLAATVTQTRVNRPFVRPGTGGVVQ